MRLAPIQVGFIDTLLGLPSRSATLKAILRGMQCPKKRTVQYQSPARLLRLVAVSG